MSLNVVYEESCETFASNNLPSKGMTITKAYLVLSTQQTCNHYLYFLLSHVLLPSKRLKDKELPNCGEKINQLDFFPQLLMLRCSFLCQFVEYNINTGKIKIIAMIPICRIYSFSNEIVIFACKTLNGMGNVK